jgi:hypothetical protein
MSSKQSRGELYVLVQAILLIALFFGPKDLLGLPTKVNQGLWLAWSNSLLLGYCHRHLGGNITRT